MGDVVEGAVTRMKKTEKKIKSRKRMNINQKKKRRKVLKEKTRMEEKA